jgi:hypothetical protein
MADDLRREHVTIFNRGVEAAKQEARVLLRTIAKMIPQNPPSK